MKKSGQLFNNQNSNIENKTEHFISRIKIFKNTGFLYINTEENPLFSTSCKAIMYRNSASKPSEKKSTKASTPKLSTPKNSTPPSQRQEPRNIRSAAPGGSRSSASSQQVRSTQGNTSTDLVTNAVFEYLEKRQMFRTLEIFKDEMNRAPSAAKDLDLGLSTNLLEV